MKPAAVVRVRCRAYPDDDPAPVLLGCGWRAIARGRWAGPWRLMRTDAEADAHAPDLAPRGRAIPVTS